MIRPLARRWGGCRSKWLGGALLLLWPLIVSAGCGADATQPRAAASDAAAIALTAEVILVSTEDAAQTVEVPASVEGYETAVLKSRLEAYVGKVLVDIGQEVRKGDPLAQLDAPEMLAEEDRLRKLVAKAQADRDTRRAELQQAEAKLEEQKAMLQLREAEYRKIDGLVRGGAVNKEQLDEAQFALDWARAAIQKAQADLAVARAVLKALEAQVEVANAELRKALALATYLTVRAPFDGLITERLVDPGALVRPASDGGTPLFKIERVDKVRAVLFLPMEAAAELNDGDAAVLHGIHSLPGARFSGTITRHAKAFNRNSRMMRAEVDLDNPLDGQTRRRKLRPGDYGKLTITLTRYKDLATVPDSAVAEDESGSYVIEVDDAYVCRRRPISVKVRADGKLGITQASGDRLAARRVIAADLGSFHDGQQLSSDQVTLVPQSEG